MGNRKDIDVPIFFDIQLNALIYHVTSKRYNTKWHRTHTI